MIPPFRAKKCFSKKRNRRLGEESNPGLSLPGFGSCEIEYPTTGPLKSVFIEITHSKP